MKERRDQNDGFFIVPVAAGGLDHSRAAKIVSTQIGLDDFNTWNLAKTDEDPISEAEAVRVAREVLKDRLKAIDASLGDDEPFTLGIWTRHPAPGQSSDSIQLDWERHFDGRIAKQDAWEVSFCPRSMGSLMRFARRTRNESRRSWSALDRRRARARSCIPRTLRDPLLLVAERARAVSSRRSGR